MTGPRSAAAPRLSVLFGFWPSSNAEHRRWLWCIVLFSPTETPVATGAMIGDPHSVLGVGAGSGSVHGETVGSVRGSVPGDPRSFEAIGTGAKRHGFGC